MSNSTVSRTKEYRHRHTIKSRLKKVVIMLACIVVFCTTYALILPALTEGTDTYCGLEEHSHTVECYRPVMTEEALLLCDPVTLGVHSHSAECYDEESRLVCGKADYVAHSHGELCYDGEGKLRCTLEERSTHIHTVECYAALEIQPTQTEIPEQETSWETESIQTHCHGEDCYELQRGELLCELSEEGHSHDADCYVSGTTLLCENTEEGHIHESACYEQLLECDREEADAHSHEDACYEQIKVLICDLEETQASVDEGSTEEVTEPITEAETVEDTEEPFHMPQANELICTTPEAPIHVHGEECFHEAERALTCTVEDETHSHTELCYGLWELICEKEEHTHKEACYSDPEADVEAAEDWEKAFEDIELSGNLREDVLAIAKTQLGYTESEKNYVVTETGLKQGYSRYGQWYGDPYGDWCAMFASFCIHYAGVRELPLESSCTAWIRDLKAMDLFCSPDSYEPQPGDLIFYDWEADGLSDHVGLVSEIKTDTDSAKTILVALEGNAANQVRYVSYDLTDSRIAGFGLMLRRSVQELLCGMQEHSHGTACYGEEGELLCTLPEHSHTDSCNSAKLMYNDDVLRASVTIDNITELPADLSLQVIPILRRDDESTFDSMQIAVSEQMEKRTEYVEAVAFYNLQLMSEGQSYELPEEAQIEVDLSFKEPVFTPEEIENSSGMRTYMLTAQAEGEEIQLPETGSSEALGDDKTPVRNPARQEDALETESTAQTESSEEQELTDGDLGAEISYLAEPTKGETVLEPEEGITGVSYRSGEIATLALALTTETQTGEFWIRLHSMDQITSGGTYMIVSAEGNYALRGDNSNNYTAVTIRSIKGNEDYFTISNSEDANLRWSFNGNNGSMIIQNQGTSNYLFMDSVRSWLISRDYLIYSDSNEMTLSYLPTEKCWRITEGSDYLRNTGSGSFSFGSGNDGNYSSTTVTYYFSRDMLIFKLSPDTTLQIPVDVTQGEDAGNGGNDAAPNKPNYPSFITPSDSKSGETSVTEAEGNGVKSVKGEYYSDPATSDIEKYYRTESFDQGEANDGRVLTDKSVIYGGDDYGAFDSYEPNTFGVTLSTIGQEYKIPYQENVRTPVDVVFILDVSGSMKDNADPDTTDENPQSRAQALVEATNQAMDEIMNDHEANRVGLVIYSGGAWELLPLDRYTAENKEYFKCVIATETHGPTNRDIERHNVLGGDTLKNAAGQSFANIGSGAEQGLGTYTQAGIAMGRKVFEDNDDTTYTTRVGFGEYERDFTVIRQPVFILLSDGEPTYSTNVYMDPLNGPHYGDGESAIDNAKGINGYYTVLTANYCKRMVGIHYQRPALFFTVGMGIYTPEQGDGVAGDDSSNTGDNYKRAVLNPTVENVQNLKSNINGTQSAEMFKSLMLGNYSGQAEKLLSAWPETWTGVPHTYVPILQGNPYATDYSYADGAYFGDITAEELAEIFSVILESSVKVSPYGFILYKNSAIDLRDNIGAGMEVKGTPVLRYNGVNYRNPEVIVQGPVTTYVYHETNVDPYIPERENDLSQITVKVVRNDDGTQTVMMYVPDSVLPTYVPELIGLKYYYEMLPVRLIYQVGLTEAAEQQVLALEGTGRELSFYTNKWRSFEEYSNSTLIPSDYNPYYNDLDPDDGILPGHQEHQEVKSENTTGTLEYAVDCHKYVDTEMDNRVRIVHTLGNNGKLVFRSDSTELPVEKRWEEVNADIMNPVTFELYKVTDQVSEEGIVTHTGVLVDSRVLSAQKGWKESFTNLPIPDGTWYYVLAEKPLSGYQGFYGGQTVQFSVAEGTMITGVKVDFDKAKDSPVIVTNAPAVKLPSTGGKGTYLYTMGGTLLVLTAALLLVYNSKLHRRREDETA